LGRKTPAATPTRPFRPCLARARSCRRRRRPPRLSSLDCVSGYFHATKSKPKIKIRPRSLLGPLCSSTVGSRFRGFSICHDKRERYLTLSPFWGCRAVQCVHFQAGMCTGLLTRRTDPGGLVKSTPFPLARPSARRCRHDPRRIFSAKRHPNLAAACPCGPKGEWKRNGRPEKEPRPNLLHVRRTRRARLGGISPRSLRPKWEGFNRVERRFDNVRYHSCLGRGSRPRIA
jgi:hypothetical protein